MVVPITIAVAIAIAIAVAIAVAVLAMIAGGGGDHDSDSHEFARSQRYVGEFIPFLPNLHGQNCLRIHEAKPGRLARGFQLGRRQP